MSRPPTGRFRAGWWLLALLLAYVAAYVLFRFLTTT